MEDDWILNTDEINPEPNILSVNKRPNTLTVDYQQITRNKLAELHTVNRPKKYKFSYNKGVIMDDFTVRPFGYKS